MFPTCSPIFCCLSTRGLDVFLHFGQSWPTVRHPQILEDQLTLFKPVGTDCLDLFAPMIFRPSYDPAWACKNYCSHFLQQYCYFVTKIGLTFCKQNAFFTCSWRFLRSNKLEQLESKLEKNIGIKKHAGKVRK